MVWSLRSFPLWCVTLSYSSMLFSKESLLLLAVLKLVDCEDCFLLLAFRYDSG